MSRRRGPIAAVSDVDPPSERPRGAPRHGRDPPPTAARPKTLLRPQVPSRYVERPAEPFGPAPPPLLTMRAQPREKLVPMAAKAFIKALLAPFRVVKALLRILFRPFGKKM